MLAKNLQGAAAAASFVYVEDVFSTYLYTGTGSSQTITNNIDLSGNGGLVWIKNRYNISGHRFTDTARGATKSLESNSTVAEATESTGLTAFGSTGFTIGADNDYNSNLDLYVSWVFRKQAKFFDVVTYTGTGVARTVSHNLGSVPGCILVKRTDTTGDWQVYHRSLDSAEYLVLNSGAAKVIGATKWNATTPTSTVFSLGTDASVNASGGTYVAYLFAHDAGGFGASGSDNVISCGAYTGNGFTTGPVVTLGYEPQWLLIKRMSGGLGSWYLLDTMRGLSLTQKSIIYANLLNEESSGTGQAIVTSTGFQITDAGTAINAPGSIYIYIAIRRGPMKTPTSGTSVFQPTVYTGTNVDNRLVNTTIAPDMVWVRQRNDTALGGMVIGDRLRGQPYLLTGTSGAEVNDADAFDQQIFSTIELGTAFSSMNGFWCGNDPTAKLNTNTTSNNHIALAFKRAPGFFDVVAYTGTGSNRTVSHNLNAVPELILIKSRSGGANGYVYNASTGNTKYLVLNTTAAPVTDSTAWDNTTPTSSVFTVGTASAVNFSSTAYIAYLFATVPGVSKVGSYTGTGATLQIDCGFTGGARFVLIKRTSSTGNWYVWDTARGIVSGNDSYLLLNSTAAEVTTTDFVDTYSAGFELSNDVSNDLNVNGSTYIFLAIA
jgi:hypothetical protein